MELFVTCSTGLEDLLLEELAELQCKKLTKGFRGVHVEEVYLNDVYRINYGSRLGSRVLMPMKKFKCFDARSLYNAASEIEWSHFLDLNTTFAIDANVSHRNLRNSLFAAQVVKDAITDQFRKKFGKRPSVNVENPDAQLNLFIHDTSGILSFDTSGIPLHKRGYRLEAVEAPMQESLAAALLRIAKYKGNEILLDPCCGSGTILVEAALIASNTAPGFLRSSWGFMRLPQFSQEEWLKVKNQRDRERVPLQPGHIFGCDISKNAVRIAKTNLRAAGFLQAVEVTQSDFRDFKAPLQPSLIVVNPPYGKRMDDVSSLKALYRSLGDFMKHSTTKPGKGFVFTASLELAKEVGLAADKRYELHQGGEDGRLLEFNLY